MTETGSRRRTIVLFVIALATVVAVYFGWRLFWFLTDDAFIGFRYISNSRLGYGYVWNAPPFRPVEGYTSFLWVVLLDVVWRASGVEPPASANYVSLLFTYLTLLLGGLMVLKMKLAESLGEYRPLFLCLVFVGVITNRTFLAWSSSGLETAMFNFFITLWIYCCLFVRTATPRWVFSLTMTTALLCLTRPDGLLFAAATVALVAKALWDAWPRQKADGEKQESGDRWERAGEGRVSSRRGVLKLALWAAPLLIIPAHILWRHALYGAWLPNTYYAKTVPGRIWPQSGLRYFLSFVMEYSLWVWVLVLLVVIVSRLRQRALTDLVRVPSTKAVVCLAVLGHFLYYTIIVGGDHFEYRVYSQLVLLIFITFLWMLSALRLRAKSAALLFGLFIVLSWPIPWLHWYATHNLNDRRTTVVMRVAVAKAAQRAFPLTPNFVLSYLQAFDQLQSWLIGHAVCMRHQEHKIFYIHLTETLPSRAEGFNLPDAGFPVFAAGSTGVVSWVLPKVNIIDVLGFNDYVVARNPDLNLPIQMAHERRAPPGYVECFSINVVLQGGHYLVTPRAEVLTAEKIVRCEQEYAALVKNVKAPEESPPVQNPIDDPRFFVRQQYLDVLDREPDTDGLIYWAEHLTQCPTGSHCFNDSRVNIVITLADPNEFQETAAFVYRLYAVSFGTVPHFADFARDRKLLASRHVDWRDRFELVPAHRAFIEDWVQRDSFRSQYPEKLTAKEFVNRLFDNGSLPPDQSERETLINSLRAGKSRAEVLNEIVEKEEFRREIDQRTVIPMQLLMQLHRDVDNAEPYRSWLEKLQRHEPVDPRRVICLILTSEEYQRRFGAVVTHSNAECP